MAEVVTTDVGRSVSVEHRRLLEMGQKTVSRLGTTAKAGPTPLALTTAQQDMFAITVAMLQTLLQNQRYHALRRKAWQHESTA